MGDQRRRMRAGSMLLVAAVATLMGCSAPVSSSSSQPSSTSSVSAAPSAPGSGFRLAAFGIHNGPADFRLPDSLTIQYVVDQPNVVTLMMAPADGPRVAAWLTQTLPTMGYTVQASSPDSVVFDGTDWSGAFTSDVSAAGLTLRKK